MLECLFIAYNAAELWGMASGHQVGPVFTIILSFLNISETLLASTTYVKNRLLNTVTYSFCFQFVIASQPVCLNILGMKHKLHWQCAYILVCAIFPEGRAFLYPVSSF